MALPAQYAWLLRQDLQPLPKVIQVAIPLIGIQEVVGKGSNKTIIQWRDELNLAGHKIVGYSDDDIPWCGLFVAYVCYKAGKVPVESPLWALNWAKFGTPVAGREGLNTSKPLQFYNGLKPSLGDVMVYKRDGGGHVEFYIGETATAYVGLGGNKSNRVQISGIEKGRLVACRRPPMTVPPRSMKPYILSSAGQITKNEQ